MENEFNYEIKFLKSINKIELALDELGTHLPGVFLYRNKEKAENTYQRVADLFTIIKSNIRLAREYGRRIGKPEDEFSKLELNIDQMYAQIQQFYSSR